MNFLFYSPHTLIDSSSGAAKCVQTLLEELVALGHRCVAVTGTVVDGPNALFEQVLQAPEAQSLKIAGSSISIPARKLTFRGVEHVVVGAKATRAEALLAYEEVVLRTVFLDSFLKLKPDVLLSYGGFTSNAFAGQHAMTHGVRSVLFAASSSIARRSDFQHVNRIVAVSKALARKLAPIAGQPVLALAPFVRTADAVPQSRTPDYITFINPSLNKGLKLVAALAVESQRLKKPYKFLFVESRGTTASAKAECPELAGCKNVSYAQNVASVAAIYAQTRILLFPSLVFETAGRIAIEANANGIPVLASNVGGIAETLDGAGYLFDPPAAMAEDWNTPPPAEYLAQWLTVLDRLHADSAEAAAAVKRAEAAAARYDLAKLTRRFLEVL